LNHTRTLFKEKEEKQRRNRQTLAEVRTPELYYTSTHSNLTESIR